MRRLERRSVLTGAHLSVQQIASLRQLLGDTPDPVPLRLLERGELTGQHKLTTNLRQVRIGRKIVDVTTQVNLSHVVE